MRGKARDSPGGQGEELEWRLAGPVTGRSTCLMEGSECSAPRSAQAPTAMPMRPLRRRTATDIRAGQTLGPPRCRGGAGSSCPKFSGARSVVNDPRPLVSGSLRHGIKVSYAYCKRQAQLTLWCKTILQLFSICLRLCQPGGVYGMFYETIKSDMINRMNRTIEENTMTNSIESDYKQMLGVILCGANFLQRH